MRSLKMKVLFINKYFFLKGGAETVFFQERKQLMEKGYEIVDFSMRHPRNIPSIYDDYFISNIDYSGNMYHNLIPSINDLKASFSLIHNNEAVKKLQKLIDKTLPRIAHLHNIYHQLTPSIIPVLKSHGIKIVLTLHDYKLICPVYSMLKHSRPCSECGGKAFWNVAVHRCYKKSLFKSLLLCIEAYWHYYKRNYSCVDIMICPSKFIAQQIRNSGFSGVPIEILHNGIDIDSITRSSADKGYYLYFGRVSEEKGVEFLVNTHSRFQEYRHDSSRTYYQLQSFPLKVVGEGEQLQRLRREYPDIDFCGYRSGSELGELIANCSFVVVPSLCSENFSMTVLEAMAYGKPIIATRIGGLPEQIDDGVTGFLIEPGNSNQLMERLAVLMSDKELRKRMGKAARDKLEKEFSFDRHLSKLIQIYKDLLIDGEPIR
jgi:glycosyltransferase involved in cell wall biosynthesis